MEIDLSDNEVEINDIDILNYIVEMLFEEQLRKQQLQKEAAAREEAERRRKLEENARREDEVSLEKELKEVVAKEHAKSSGIESGANDQAKSGDNSRKTTPGISMEDRMAAVMKTAEDEDRKDRKGRQSKEIDMKEDEPFRKYYPKSHLLHYIYDADPVKGEGVFGNRDVDQIFWS